MSNHKTPQIRSVVLVDVNACTALCRTDRGDVWVDVAAHSLTDEIWRAIPDADLARLARAVRLRREMLAA